MAGATITAQFEDSQVRRSLVVLASVGRDQGVLSAVGAALARNTRQRFDEERDPEGNAWKALSEGYAAVKKGAGILRESAMRGGLQGSIISAVPGGGAVTVGTNKVYGAVHQFGIGPDGWRTPRQLTIDARPYLGFSEQDADTTREVIYDGLARLLH